MDDQDYGCLFVFIVAVAAVAFGVGCWVCANHWRQKAVDNGAAEWVLDQKDGAVKFEWKHKAEKDTW